MFPTVFGHRRLEVFEVRQCSMYFIRHMTAGIRLQKERRWWEIRSPLREVRSPAVTCLTLGSIFFILSVQITTTTMTASHKREILLRRALLWLSSLHCFHCPSSCWFIENHPVLYDSWEPVTSRPHTPSSYLPQKNKRDLISMCSYYQSGLISNQEREEGNFPCTRLFCSLDHPSRHHL